MTGIAEEIAYERQLVGAKRLRYSTNSAQLYHEWYNAVLLGLLNPATTSSVLDCGCGTGVLLPALRQRYRRAVGVDLCFDNLREARTADRTVPLVVGDIRQLPLSAESFDHIVCRGVMHRLADAEGGFAQLFAALKAGGELVIAEPIKGPRLLEALRHAASSAGLHPVPGRRFTPRSCQEWSAAAQSAGFRTLGWFHLGYVAFPLIGFPEALAPLRYVPWRMPVARCLLRVDRVLARVPALKRCSWQAVFHFQKPAIARPAARTAGGAAHPSR